MKIKDIVAFVPKSITPKAGKIYRLYSLPSFDDGRLYETLDGKNIQSNKYIVPDKCILFNKLNVRFKRVLRIDESDTNKVCSTEYLPLVVNESKVDYQYCYYLLISDKITNYLCGQNTNTSGSHKRINPDNFLDINIILPELAEQKRIGKLLSDIDHKIELNRAINQNLEAMAKQLYDYWFVQFDFPNEEGKPYKSSGEVMVYNERLGREIPQGWSTMPISEILDKYPTTKRYETKEYLSCGKYPIIDQGDSYIAGFTNEIDHLLTRHPAVLFGDHSTKVKFLDFDYARGADGTQILYSSNKAVSQYYLYLAVSALQIPNPGYSRHFKYLKELPIIIPDLKIANKFKNIVKPLFEEWTKNIFCNIELTKQSNELLPLLMNGQVSVNSDLAVLYIIYGLKYQNYEREHHSGDSCENAA